jgi:hypothetical protein
MKLGGSLPHSQTPITCPYPSQINPFLCPSHFWQAQVVSFLVGLRTYQHPVNDHLVSKSVPFYSLTVIFQNSFSINYFHLRISEFPRVFVIVANETRAISFLLCQFASSHSVNIMHSLTEYLANGGFGKHQWISRKNSMLCLEFN